ncbi:alpha/beta fold hydrolase [Neobacillus cucumis]
MVYSDDQIKHPGLLKSSKAFIQSKDYSMIDVYNTFVKGFKLVYHLDFIKEIATVNYKEQLLKVSIPVSFIHGTKDVHVFGELVEDYYKVLEADKGKRFIWLDKSSHAFHPEDTKIIEQHIIEELKHYKK